MPRVLLVVARDRDEFFHSLQRGFAGADGHEVILDRRVGDDRRQRRQTAGAERRTSERRSQDEVPELHALGHAVVFRD